jgi:hypothetical protein
MEDHDFVESALRHLWDQDSEALLPEQATVLLVWPASGFLDNGGILSLVECLGDQSEAVVAAFVEVGLPRRAAAVAAGLALFPRRSHSDHDVRLSLPVLWRLGADARIDRADERWFSLEDDEPVDAAVASYVRAHPNSFTE